MRAVVIDRSLQELAEIRTEGVLSELDGGRDELLGARLAARRVGLFMFRRARR